MSDEGRWTTLAERLLEQALNELRSGNDAVSATSAALAALTAGDRPEAEQDDLWGELVAEPDDAPCTCPPDLVARGGFRSGCPAHGNGGAS